MKHYLITLVYDCSETVEIEADSREQAIQMAYQNARGDLCYHCAGRLDLGDIIEEHVDEED